MGIPKRTLNVELTLREVDLIVDSLSKSEEVKVSSIADVGKEKTVLMMALIDSRKTNNQRVKDMEPRQPVMKQKSEDEEKPQEPQNKEPQYSNGY